MIMERIVLVVMVALVVVVVLAVDYGQKTVNTDPGLPCMTPYTQLRIFHAEHTGLNGKAKLATPL